MATAPCRCILERCPARLLGIAATGAAIVAGGIAVVTDFARIDDVVAARLRGVAICGATIATPSVAIVARFVRISDTVAARLATVGRATVAREVIAVVARLAGIGYAVSARRRDAQMFSAGGHASQTRRADPAVVTAIRGRLQTTDEYP
jgi:hypothetical protein